MDGTVQDTRQFKRLRPPCASTIRASYTCLVRRALALAFLVTWSGACGAGAATDDGGSSDDAAAGADASGAGDDGGAPGLVPPLSGSSHGSGGAAPVAGLTRQAGGVTWRLIVPDNPEVPSPLLVVYSGTEGGALMTQNLLAAAAATGTDGYIRVVLDGVTYRGDGSAGATALDDVRAHYDIDNDRTYLLGESAGTSAALSLGFHLRQSYFAAYWANDVNDTDAPEQTAAQLGFAPWGQAGPGGDFPDAQSIVDAMSAAGYRLPDPAPYAGQGAGTHGDKYQFVAALRFFADKTRQ